jgi:dTDP-4-amino-4,6-dideoxygalactose transaminase
MSEINAAVGLAVLPKVDDEIKRRKELFSIYMEKINEWKGIVIPYKRPDVIYNYQYFPIIIDKNIYQLSRDEIHNKLKNNNITSRRYFYPLCSNLNYCSTNLTKYNVPYANKMAESVLVLPLHGDLTETSITKICDVFTNIKFR